MLFTISSFFLIFVNFVCVAIIIERDITTKKEIPNPYLYAWWSSSINSCCILFNCCLDLWKGICTYTMGSFRKLHFLLTSLLSLLWSSFWGTCCCWFYWVFELAVVSLLNALHVASRYCCFWFCFDTLYCVYWNWIIEIARI